MSATTRPPHGSGAMRVRSPLIRQRPWVSDGRWIAHESLAVFAPVAALMPRRGYWSLAEGGASQMHDETPDLVALVAGVAHRAEPCVVHHDAYERAADCASWHCFCRSFSPASLSLSGAEAALPPAADPPAGTDPVDAPTSTGSTITAAVEAMARRHTTHADGLAHRDAWSPAERAAYRVRRAVAAELRRILEDAS